MKIASLLKIAGLFSVFAALTSLLTQAVSPVRADAVSYGTRRQIKACVLVFGVNPPSYAPHFFYVLDSRTDIKPTGWDFVNPMAPSIVTGDTYSRWQQRGAGDPAFTPGSPESKIFQVGSPLTKNMAPYWEVNADKVTSEDLAQFDIVYIGVSGATNFAPEVLQKLRKFADGGGAVMLEDLGNTTINNNGPFLAGIQFNTNNAGVPFLPILQRQHALADFPFGLSQLEVLSLGRKPGGGYGAGSHTFDANTRLIAPVVGIGGRPYVSAGDYGAGHLVISSAALARGVSGFVGGANVQGLNTGVISGQNMFAVRTSDLKFSYNVIAWANGAPTASSTARRSSANNEQIGSVLARKFSTPFDSGPGFGSGAVISKGILYYVDGNNVLHAYDANPGQDLDTDLNPDEGLRDFANGAPYDEIWRQNLNLGNGIRVSTPTVVSTADVSGAARDIVTVTTSTGVTLGFLAQPRNAQGQYLAATSPAWAPVQLDNANLANDLQLAGLNGNIVLPAPAPVVSDGILFTLGYRSHSNGPGDPNAQWRIVPIDPITGFNVFGSTDGVAPYVGSKGNLNFDGLPSVVGPLTAGYVRDEATGADDLMIYASTRPLLNQPVGGVQGVWFRTRNEPLTATAVNGNTVYRATGERARIPWWTPGGGPSGFSSTLLPVLHVSFRDVAGQVVRTQEFLYNNQFTVTFNTPPGNDFTDVTITGSLGLQGAETSVTITADYTVDWPAVNANAGKADMQRFTVGRRYTLISGGQNPVPTFLTGPVALSRPDLLLYNSAWDNPGPNAGATGRTFALREQFNSAAQAAGGPGGGARRRRGNGSEVAWMFAPISPDPNGGSRSYSSEFGQTVLNPRFVNIDPFAPGNSAVGPIGQVVQLFQPIGSPAIANGVAYVVGSATLQGNPGFSATVVMALRANPNMSFSVGSSLSATAGVQLRQINLNESILGPNGERSIQLTENREFFVDRQSGTVTISNFRQPGNESFNTALPIRVVITDAGQQPSSILVQDQQTGFGPLDNVLWYMLIPQNTLAGGNALPNEIKNIVPASGATVNGDVLYFGTADGYIASVNLSGAPTDGKQWRLFGTEKSRVAKMRVIDDGNGNALSQPIINPPVGFANTVAVGTGRGLAALENQLTLIADNSRLLEVNAVGEAVWSLNTTRSSSFNNNGIAISRAALSRPNVAHRTANDGYIIADTGNNRVMQLDRGGAATWEIRTLKNEMNFLRPGDPTNLNAPTDVQVFTEGSADPSSKISLLNPTTNVTYSYTGRFFAVHYVIADSGNYRAVEVVEAYDGTGNPVLLTPDDGSPAVPLLRQVVFVTRTLSEQNNKFRYRTIQQFRAPVGNGFQNFLIAAVDNARGAAVDPGAVGVGINGTNEIGPGGSIVVMRRYPVPPMKDGDVAAVINNLTLRDPNAPGGKRFIAISNPVWFKEFEVLANGAPSPRYILADDNGCYVLRPTATDAEIEWMLTADDYYYMTGRRLRAASIQRLPQSDWDAAGQVFRPRYLITNRYSGEDNVPDLFGFVNANGQPLVPRGMVNGEVFEVRSLDYFNGGYRTAGARLYQQSNDPNNNYLVRNINSAIQWLIPNETFLGQNDIKVPRFPNRIIRSIGSQDGATSTFNLEQPTFSERPN